MLRFWRILFLLLCGLLPIAAAENRLTVSTSETGVLDADYTTTKLFIDEIAGDSVPLDIVFKPASPLVEQVEVWTNLNRRDLADEDADGDGYDDGIVPPDADSIQAGDDRHYFKAYPMEKQGDGAWRLVLNAEKTGAYRLTARWKVPGEDRWHWFTDHRRGLRDHAVVVSPKEARDIRLYEINVLNIEASGDTHDMRSTIEDMHNAPGAPHNAKDRWNLDYLLKLGANWLWFQPIHVTADAGREPSGGWGTDTPPYEPGSPYAVRNFFEVNPIFSIQKTREGAMRAWREFSAAADLKGVGLMLDAPFNHTAHDVELGEPGVRLFQPDGAEWKPGDLFRDRVPRLFSYRNNYGQRAESADRIAPAPDRSDFGKWRDAIDVHFGRYAALVETPVKGERIKSGEDWFDFDGESWNSEDFVQGGRPKNVTRLAWRYFAEYAPYWIGKTRPEGRNRNSSTEPGLTEAERRDWDAAGIDGLRCDFGQGLPPQAWEYITNVVREKKWNFVMMSESLDGGPVTYRSNRHFDVLNESIVFAMRDARTASDYRKLFEERRQQFGPSLVLLNTTSHDEENAEDPWQALTRYAVASTQDGIPMIFPGQELGIRKTWGYDHYERNLGKMIPHFKRYNSMMPVWNDQEFRNDQLFQVYAAINRARAKSPALRSANRWFLDTGNEKVVCVAKWEKGSSPVIAFVNLEPSKGQKVSVKLPQELFQKLGLREDGIYQARNIAAYENPGLGVTGRSSKPLWGTGRRGGEFLNGGLEVELNPVPVVDSDWKVKPYEVAYLEIGPYFFGE